MNSIEKLLEIHEHIGKGYQPVVDYQAWRVAVLNYSDELQPEKLTNMQRHDETDEVFVLLQGRCILFVGSGDDTVGDIYAEDMRLLKIYNVKRAVWHNHILSEDAKVLVVENKNTTYDNSPFCDLDPRQRQKVVFMSQSLWNGSL